MKTSVVGYRLVNGSGLFVREWGGVWGQCPGLPNPLILPTGEHVHAPLLNTDYKSFTLVEWIMDEPAPTVPASITPRQCRLVLMQQGLLAEAEKIISVSDEASRITWEYALEFRRDDPLLLRLAKEFNLEPPVIDQFFIEASKL